MPRAGSVVWLVLLAAASTSRAEADPVRVLVIGATTGIVAEAEAAFVARHGAGALDVRTADDEVTAADLAGMNVVFTYYARNETLRRLAPLLERARDEGVVILGAPGAAVETYRRAGPVDLGSNAQAEAYWDNGGLDNLTSFLELVYRLGGGARTMTIAPPVPAVLSGIYHPGARSSEGKLRSFASLQDYVEWYRRTGLTPANAPLVGILFSHGNIRFQDLRHVDALIAAIERRGLGAVPIYGWPLPDVEPYLAIDGRRPLRVLLALSRTVLRPDEVAVLERAGVPVMNLLVTGESEQEWAAGSRGLPPDRIQPYLQLPERAGATEPILVAARSAARGGTVTLPIAERIEAAVRRVKRWVALQDLPNRDKRIAVLYYNNPPGRGNIGASYLRVFPSVVRLLERMRDAGYKIGDAVPDEPALIDLLERGGRNLELWAPGELETLVRDGRVVLVPIETYRRWSAELPSAFRDAVIREWGPPEQARLMAYTAPSGQRYFVVPGVRLGNIFIGPQPLRTTFERAVETSHDRVTPVPHAYVAAYLWYRHTFGADAVVHVGRHGTLEWLPGKQVAQSGADESEVLLGDLPNPYVYIMDGGGEAIQAKRRGAAVLVSHLTPLAVAAGPRADFDPLHQALDQLERIGEGSPELAMEYRQQVLEDLRRLKLDRQLGLDLDTMPWPAIQKAAHDFSHSVTNMPIPGGIHALGELPPEQVQRDAVTGVITSGFLVEHWPLFASEIEGWVGALVRGDLPTVQGRYTPEFRERLEAAVLSARTWIDALRESTAQELGGVLRVLDGRYLPTAPLGDPLRVPAALPAGRNLHAFDAALIPTRAAWSLGRKMADRLLARALEDTGAYPGKVSVSLWYGETERHQGAMEAMALHLLGVEPIWNPRGVVEDLRLIPIDRMGHPRIDVVFTITGIYRDGFADKVLLLDRAVRLAASAGDNAVSRHDAAVVAALLAGGVARPQAERLARARVFGNRPGHYGLGVERLVDAGLNAGRDATVAALFLHNMGAAFSGEMWGEQTPGALAAHLEGNEVVVFSRSSNLYGVLDNEDTYAYVGGLALATRTITGRAPQYYVNDLRKSGAESLVDLQAWLAHELNARSWNPYWLQEMMRSGYAGARQMARELDHLYGFQATTPERVDGTFWQESFDVFVADRHGLRLDAFFAGANPLARQRLLARLLDVDRQGAYRFSDADRRALVEQYVSSVGRDGFSCTALTCGGGELLQYAEAQAALIPGLSKQALPQFRRAVASATRPRLLTRLAPGATTEARNAPPAPPRGETTIDTSRRPVTGFLMQEWTQTTPDDVPRPGVSLAYVSALLALVCAGAFHEARGQRRQRTFDDEEDRDGQYRHDPR